MTVSNRTRKDELPSTTEVDSLIARADAHPLGREFLCHGAQDAVAATFQVHAFVVDAARERLGNTESASR